VPWVIQQKMNNTHSQTNFRRIATPVLGFLPGKRHATPIMPYVIGAALFLPFTFVFLVLKAGNTSYHKRLHGLHRFVYYIFASFTACKHLAFLAHDFGREGSIFLYFI
jgi:hypothetical protein